MTRQTMQRPAVAELHRRCVIEATIEPLRPFRRGYARSKWGPFYQVQTIKRLVERGDLRVINGRAGLQHSTITARSL